MAPIEILRGRTPEEVAGKFNQREAEGWKPVSQGSDEAEERHFMSIYRPLANPVGEQGPEMSAEGVMVSEEQIDHVHYILRQTFPKGKATKPIRDREATSGRYYGTDGKEASIAFLFPPDPNMPMAKLFFSLVRHGFGTVESLLSFPEDQEIRGFGPKNRQAVQAIKEILIGKNQ